jgi:hypothetical protein
MNRRHAPWPTYRAPLAPIKPPVLCEEHTGELYPPRCSDCDAVAALPPMSLVCDLHPAHLLPCDKCAAPTSA